MPDIEVHIDLDGVDRSLGFARTNRVRGNETLVFEYDPSWLEAKDRFAIEPSLPLTRGGFAPPEGQAIFGSLGDSAPTAQTLPSLSAARSSFIALYGV